MEAEEVEVVSQKTRDILYQQAQELEKEIAQLTKARNELMGILDETPEVASKDGVVHTGKFLFKNRFSTEQGYATGTGYRILYELQDEGPNFINGIEYPTIRQAREYVQKHNDSSTIYTIIAPDGEIVR